MTLAEKLRFLAERMEDGKEFYMEDRLLKYDGCLSPRRLADILLLDIFQSTFKLKPQWEFTEDEKVILRNLSDDYQWIARDKNWNGLCAYTLMPTKYKQYWVFNEGNMTSLNGFGHLFQSIQWTDDEPCEFRRFI